MINKFFYIKSCHLWNNVEKFCIDGQDIYDNITGRMRFVCYITKATNTHLDYVIIKSFPQQHRLHECSSILRYTYTALLFCSCIKHAFRFIVRKLLNCEISHMSWFRWLGDDCSQRRLLFSSGWFYVRFYLCYWNTLVICKLKLENIAIKVRLCNIFLY